MGCIIPSVILFILNYVNRNKTGKFVLALPDGLTDKKRSSIQGFSCGGILISLIIGSSLLSFNDGLTFGTFFWSLVLAVSLWYFWIAQPEKKSKAAKGQRTQAAQGRSQPAQLNSGPGTQQSAANKDLHKAMQEAFEQQRKNAVVIRVDSNMDEIPEGEGANREKVSRRKVVEQLRKTVEQSRAPKPASRKKMYKANLERMQADEPEADQEAADEKNQEKFPESYGARADEDRQQQPFSIPEQYSPHKADIQEIEDLEEVADAAEAEASAEQAETQPQAEHKTQPEPEMQPAPEKQRAAREPKLPAPAKDEEFRINRSTARDTKGTQHAHEAAASGPVSLRSSGVKSLFSSGSQSEDHPAPLSERKAGPAEIGVRHMRSVKVADNELLAPPKSIFSRPDPLAKPIDTDAYSAVENISTTDPLADLEKPLDDSTAGNADESEGRAGNEEHEEESDGRRED